MLSGHRCYSPYKSQTFKTALLSDRFYDGFALPDYLK
jgi:D-methionine transport system substrate-binding protein